MSSTVVVAARGGIVPGRPAPTTPDGGAVLVAAPTVESVAICPTCCGTPRTGVHTRTGWQCWLCREVHPWAA